MGGRTCKSIYIIRYRCKKQKKNKIHRLVGISNNCKQRTRPLSFSIYEAEKLVRVLHKNSLENKDQNQKNYSKTICYFNIGRRPILNFLTSNLQILIIPQCKKNKKKHKSSAFIGRICKWRRNLQFPNQIIVCSYCI